MKIIILTDKTTSEEYKDVNDEIIISDFRDDPEIWLLDAKEISVEKT